MRQAFGRYLEAGNVWGDDLRAACHTLAMQWLLLSEPGAWHDGDHERVIAHIAAIPIVLKMELRDSRDVRELKGLLSEKDIGRILTAESMSTHCVDVIRAYYWTAVCRPGTLVDRSKIIATCRKSYIKVELRNLEEAIRLCKTLKAFPIAKGFLVLLRTILGIWFILLPFVLSESNGERTKVYHLINSGRCVSANHGNLIYASHCHRMVLYFMDCDHWLWPSGCVRHRW